MRKIFRDFLGTLMVLIPAIIAGIYLASPNERFDNRSVSYVLLIISSAVIGLSLILGIITVIFAPEKRKKQRVNVSKDRQRIWKYTESCDRDLPGEMKKIKRLVVLERIYFFLICFCTALGFASCAALGYSGVSVIFGFAAFWTVCFKNITVTDADEPGLVIDEEGFPMLKAAVTEALKQCLPEAEYGKDVYAFVVHGSEVNAISWRNSYALCIGVSAVGLLSEEQLKGEMFNKLCRVKSGDCDFSADIVTLYTKYSARTRFFSMGSLLMSLPMLIVRRRIPDFMTASSRAADLSSDKACAELMSDAQKRAYLGAVATAKMFEYYLTECAPADIYAENEPPFSFESDMESGFKQALQSREGFWRELIEKELVARNAPYPTFAVRREVLGAEVDAYDICPDTDSYAYNVERDVIKRHADKIIREGMAVNYESQRKASYLEPLEFYEKYLKRLQNGEKPNLAERVDAAFAAECVGRETEACAIYDDILREYPSNPNALYRRGLLYLSEYDERGVDMVFAAMRGNSNCVSNGAQAVNDFCVKLGLEERLEECRELSAELFDYKINKYSRAVSIEKNDVYRPASLPTEVISEIVEEIKRQCGDALESVYMVSKTYEDVTATLIFIVPTAGYDAEAWDTAYSNIFTFLDVRDEDFLLDSYTGEGKYMAKIKKTPGSLVYSKDTNADIDINGGNNE